MRQHLTIVNRQVKAAKRVLACLLLGLYVSGMCGYEIHKAVHLQEHAVAHTTDVEQDPCHRSLYHEDNEDGCRHHAHIVSNTQCSVCDITVPIDVDPLPVLSFPSDFISDPGTSLTAQGALQGNNSLLPARAPPGA